VRTNRRWLALIATSLATFMIYLDNNVVNVALPTIQRELGLTLSGLEWIASSYILVFAGLLLVGGRVADVYGRRRTFFAGLAIFTLASLAAGLAGSQEALIAARAAQGLGAAVLAPTTLALITSMFPNPRERATAVGVWGSVGALALAIGPLTGGYLSEHASWGWIFLINVPIGAGTGVLAALSLPAVRAGARRALDVPGLASSSLALFALTYALIEGESQGWASAGIIAAFGLAAAALVVFLVVESRAADAMADLSFLRNRVFSGGLIAMGGWAFGVFGIYFYTAIFLQNVLGFSPVEAGAGFVPMAVVMSVVAALAPRVEARFGAGPTVAVALTVMAGAVLGLAALDEGAGYLDLLPWFVAFGLGGGLLIPLTNVVLGALPPARTGVAAAMLNASREMSGLLGVTVLGAILTARQNAATGPELHRFLAGYQGALVVAGLLVGLGAPVALWSLRRTPTPAAPPPFPQREPELQPA
jgi:EmrB/QacA subfamily drug resistance transporter